VLTPAFEVVVIVFIFVSSVSLALDEPGTEPTDLAHVLSVVDLGMYIYRCIDRFLYIYKYGGHRLHLRLERLAGVGWAVVGCKIPRKENSPIF